VTRDRRTLDVIAATAACVVVAAFCLRAFVIEQRAEALGRWVELPGIESNANASPTLAPRIIQDVAAFEAVRRESHDCRLAVPVMTAAQVERSLAATPKSDPVAIAKAVLSKRLPESAPSDREIIARAVVSEAAYAASGYGDWTEGLPRTTGIYGIRPGDEEGMTLVEAANAKGTFDAARLVAVLHRISVNIDMCGQGAKGEPIRI
jgi:hypothetical protein